jgi:L-aminopeptidase/D-esterase-like protein
MNIAITIANTLSAVAALTAAFLWHRSATVRVTHKDNPDESGTYPAAIIVDDNVNFINTAMAQAMWSKRGSLAAAIAAALQGIVQLLQIFSA